MPHSPTPGTASNVALLAPVPLAHLTDGAAVANEKGKVAFGSRAWEVFRRLDGLRDGLPVEVWIYASHAHVGGPPKATWRARYIGHVETPTGAHPDGSKFRPPSTTEGGEDKAGHWGLFWEVEDLRELAPQEAMLVTRFQGFDRKSRYAKLFVPEGPLLVLAV
jgi:hypothetical protein